MSLTFPASPTVGDTYTVGARTWSWSGTIWEMTGTVAVAGSIGTAELAASAVTTAKIAAGAVTAAKLGNDISLTPADGSITQAKLTSGLSGITVTTTANRSAVIPSPFNGQFIFLTDTSELQRWNGSAWVSGVSSPPTEAPTSLALVSATATTATISFAAGAEGGSAITNYQYALSTNSGSSYGSYNALATPDATSPITIPGLTAGTAYYIKLKAVNAQGTSTVESSALSFSTISVTVDYLVVAGGGSGGGGTYHGGGGGAGGLLSGSWSITSATSYTVVVGAGGASVSGLATGNNGVNSSITGSGLTTVNSIGGGGGGSANNGAPANGNNGGSGGGGAGISNGSAGPSTGGAGTANQGYAGGTNTGSNSPYRGGGGGGSGAVGIGGTGTHTGHGGIGTASSITGSSVTYAGGGGGSSYNNTTTGNGGAGGGGNGGDSSTKNPTAGTANTGGGGGGAERYSTATSGAGGSGVVILRYPNVFTITIGAGLTGSTATDGSSKVTTLTAGTGNVSWAE